MNIDVYNIHVYGNIMQIKNQAEEHVDHHHHHQPMSNTVQGVPKKVLFKPGFAQFCLKTIKNHSLTAKTCLTLNCFKQNFAKLLGLK